MHDPLVCYKYRSGAAALRCLSDGTVYFAPSRELNDSLEAKFDVVDPEQYVAAIERTLADLSSQRGDTRLVRDRRAIKQIEAANAAASERFVSECEQVGIFSGAPRPDNQPMWAYYCDSGKGFCFHLEWSRSLIEKWHLISTEVVYLREARLLNRADDVRDVLREVSAQNPTWSLDQLKAFCLSEPFVQRVRVRAVSRAMSMKHSDWEHEREVRMLAPQANALPLMQEILKSVIFTCTDFPEWGPVVMLLRQLYPKVRLAQMAFSHREPFVSSHFMTEKLVPIYLEASPWSQR